MSIQIKKYYFLLLQNQPSPQQPNVSYQNHPGYPPPSPQAPPTVQADPQTHDADENVQKAGYLLQQ